MVSQAEAIGAGITAETLALCQPGNDPANLIPSRTLTNFELSYLIPDKNLTVSVYGTNIFDKVYDEARQDDPGAGIMTVILSNDCSEFGVKIRKKF